MPELPRLAVLVSHTHWDREWYLPFHTFRVMLARTVKGVLDALDQDPAYRHFCLDGQAVVLEDFLEVCPEERERVARLAAAGSLALGPWYVLPDEFLIPPEATVRNLVLGHRVAAAFAGAQKVGYVPDAFGHVAQLPQVLKRAGIDSIVYTRGDGDEIDETGLEWTWEAPDGSEVLAVQQCGSYCNASGLGYAEMWHAHTEREVDPARAVEQVRAIFERMAERSNGDVWLLNNGCDHFPAQRDFSEVLDALRAAFPDVEFLHGSFAEYLRALRSSEPDLRRHRGELRGGRLHHVLSGVWSARMPLKQRNAHAHAWLADVAEPLAAYAHFAHGRPYPQGLLEYAWKLLLKNQPHDSICGCSIDEVHREMEPRFDGVLQTAEQVTRDALQTLVPTFGVTAAGDRDTALGLFHPLPERRRAVLERLVVLQPFEYDFDRLRVVDDDGASLPFEVVEKRRVRRFWGVDWRLGLDVERQRERFEAYASALGTSFVEPEETADPVDDFVHLRVLADLPPVGFARLRLVEDGSLPVPRLPAAERVRVADDVLANGLVSVRLHGDGTLDLVDEGTGRAFEGLNVLEDVEDVGDEYDHSPAQETRRVASRGVTGDVDVVERGELRAALEARFVLALPARIDPDRARRARDEVSCGVAVRVTLDAGSPVVDLDVRFENRAEDHRLAALFPAGLRTETVVSDVHFGSQERSVDPPAGEDWCQPPPDTVPQQDYTYLRDDAGGLCVLNRGLPEVAAVRDGTAGVGLRLTLLRSVGWLSRDDFPTRRCQNAGPTIPTPDAQCLGPQRFRYAVLPFGAAVGEAELKAWSRRWATPVPVVQGVVEGSTAGGPGLVALASGRAAVTAVKRHEACDHLVVRLYNLTGEPLEEVVEFGFVVGGAWSTNLLEEREADLEVQSGKSVTVSLGPHEIATIEVEPRP